MEKKKTIALAFSGGLDTSFYVPYLIERGWEVVTVFVDTGGVGSDGIQWIHERAMEVGACEHVTLYAGQALWDSIVTPMVMGGEKYQGRYPLLCADRYVIAEELVKLAHDRGCDALGHGCTAMGNDQVRFDQTIRSLSALPIVAPIREIQSQTDSPRDYEIEALRAWGIDVSVEAKRYTVNENLLGVTVSGSEIDQMGAPGEQTRKLTNPPEHWPSAALRMAIGFERGRAVSVDGVELVGPSILQLLNERFGAYGVGRGIYTGDTIVGLKGRIVFECPGLEALFVAHKALEELVLSKAQNEMKPGVARRWTELVFGGMFFEPLREDIECMVRSTQQSVTGEVIIETAGGVCDAIEVRTQHALIRDGACYAQHADWSAGDADGFIRIHGQSGLMGAQARLAQTSQGAPCLGGC